MSVRGFIRGVLAVLVVGLAVRMVPAAELGFAHHELVTGKALHQTVLPGFFLGGETAELAVASLVRSKSRRLRIYALEEDTWTQKIDADLGSEVLLVDVATLAGRERILLYEPGRVSWFDPDSEKARPLVKLTLDFTPSSQDGIHFADITRDLNDDGRDDLVIPGTDGFRVLVQKSDGTFAGAVKLGPPEPHLEDTAFLDRYSYGEMGISPISLPWYLGRVHRMDYDRDGRSDLVFWNKDRFEVHLQDDHGMFSAEPKTFKTEVEIDSDGEYSLQYGVTLADGKKTALHSISDLDGDGVADLVTMALEGPGIFKRTVYGVHLGKPVPGGTRFAREAEATIRSKGIRRGLRRVDLDGDGKMDLKFSTIDLGDMGLAEMQQVESFAVHLDFFRMQGGGYPGSPSATRELAVTRSFSSPVLIGDVSGDGRPDLLFGKDGEELHVFPGVPGPELFAGKPRIVKVDVPPDDESSIDIPYRPCRLVDLDRDGKQDVLIHRASTTRPHRVTVLIAR